MMIELPEKIGKDYKFLEKGIDEIVVVHGSKEKPKESPAHLPDGWNKEKSDNKYLFKGTITNQNLRTKLTDEVKIECDLVNEDKKDTKADIEIQINLNILKEDLIKNNTWSYGTGHGGISDYITLFIQGFDELEMADRKAYMKIWIRNKGVKLKYTKLDENVACSKKKLIPIEFQPHWKAEHEGAIHDLKWENCKGSILEIDKAILKEVQKPKPSPKEVPERNYNREDRLINHFFNNFIKKVKNGELTLKGGQEKNDVLLKNYASFVKNEQKIIEFCDLIQHPFAEGLGWLNKNFEPNWRELKRYIQKYFPELESCYLPKKTEEEETDFEIKPDDGLYESLMEALFAEGGGRRPEATELLTTAILKDNHIYTTRDDEHEEMWIYNKGIYVPQGKTYIREFNRKALRKVYTTNLTNQVIAKIEADTYIDSQKFFTNNIIEEVAVKNGLLNIFTKELKEFTPHKIFFNKLPVLYDTSKDCLNVKQHFETVLKNKEDIQVMQELFGFLLLKEYKIEKAIMFNGLGRNGKGKTLELMKRFVGAQNCSSISIQALEKEMFASCNLFSKMANIAGDISPTALEHTGKFKECTGRDLITAPRKFLPPIYFVNYAKMIFAANELPRTADLTPAFWNRWVYLEFPYRFLTQKEIDKLDKDEKKIAKLIDPNIIQTLTTDNELSGVLNWALQGLHRLLEQKNFSYSKTAAEVERIWLEKSDSVAVFLKDCVEEGYGEYITKGEMRKHYSEYCKERQLKKLGNKEFKQTILQITGAGESIENNTRVWEGIKFKSKEKEIMKENEKQEQLDQPSDFEKGNLRV